MSEIYDTGSEGKRLLAAYLLEHGRAITASDNRTFVRVAKSIRARRDSCPDERTCERAFARSWRICVGCVAWRLDALHVSRRLADPFLSFGAR